MFLSRFNTDISSIKYESGTLPLPLTLPFPHLLANNEFGAIRHLVYFLDTSEIWDWSHTG